MNKLHYSEDVAKELTNLMFLSPLWNEFDRGVLQDKELLEHFYKAAPHLKEEITTTYGRLAETIRVKPYTHNWLKDLKKKGYRLYVLSNYPEYTYKKTQEALSFQRLMDGCIWSYEYKVIKPEPEIYQLLLDQFKLNPKETLFLDDKKANLEGAKKFGIKTILFTSQKEAKQKMKEYGIS